MALLALGHSAVDIYQGAIAALVPYFLLERDYTYAAASGIVLAFSLISSIAQPLFGVLTDRWVMPWLVPVATVASGVGIALTGLADSYGLTLVFAAIGGAGVAAYHPESARMARIASGGSHRAMAWFSTGGNLGFTVAPLAVAATVGAQGLRYTPLLVIPALAGVAITLPVLTALARQRSAGVRQHVPTGGDDLPAFLRLSLAVTFRSIAFVGLSTFIAVYASQRIGGAVTASTAGTIALLMLYIGGAGGSILGGALASRWNRVTVARGASLLSTVAVACVVLVPGPALYPLLVLTSIGLYVPFSLQITLGQDYLPSRIGTASGVTLGLTVSVGGLASPVLGALADATSLRTALIPLIAMPLLSWLCWRTLQEPEPGIQSSTAPEVPAGGTSVVAPAAVEERPESG